MRAPLELLSPAETFDRLEARTSDPLGELRAHLRRGSLKVTGLVDGGERREITPEEWRDYDLKLSYGYFVGVGRISTIDVLSVRVFPAAAVKDRSQPAGVRMAGGEPGYYRVITDVLVPVSQVMQLCPGPAEAKRGRPPDFNWPRVKELLKEWAVENGPVQTRKELLQKCGDFAAELDSRHRIPADSTIDAAIKKYRLDVAAGFAPGK
jgi:hypothetical protein